MPRVLVTADKTSVGLQFNDAIGLRDQAYGAMRDAAHAKQLLASLDACVGTAETPEALAFGLTEVGGLLRAWLKSGDAGLVARLEIAGLDVGYADELEASAKALRVASAKAGARGTAAKITQGALDRQDGVAFILLRQIVRAFESAHDRNPTIPRLVPIATRRLFSRPKKKKDPEGTTGTTNTNPNAKGASDEKGDAANKGSNQADNESLANKPGGAENKPVDSQDGGTGDSNSDATKPTARSNDAAKPAEKAPVIEAKPETTVETGANLKPAAKGAPGGKKKGRRK
jgi:hypothetical protein